MAGLGGGRNRGVTVGSDGPTDNWATAQSPSHPSVCPGGLAEAGGRGIRGAFVPRLAVLSLIREVGQRQKKGGPCGETAAARAVIGVDAANRRQLLFSATDRELLIAGKSDCTAPGSGVASPS